MMGYRFALRLEVMDLVLSEEALVISRKDVAACWTFGRLAVAVLLEWAAQGKALPSAL